MRRAGWPALICVALLGPASWLTQGCAPEIPSGVYVCSVDEDCPPAQVCQAGRCFRDECRPLTCEDRRAECGQIDDRCGGTLDCGSCAGGEPCVGNLCCEAASCDGRCGMQSDGCGGTLDCGGCPPGETCGGGGAPNVCGVGTCTPLTCAELGYGCGPTSNGCGDIIDCGTCDPPNSCGGGGTPNECGCLPAVVTCGMRECGDMDDGCGGAVSCGSCGDESICSLAGTCCPDPCVDVCGPVMDPCAGFVECRCDCTPDPDESDNQAFPGAPLGMLAPDSSARVQDHNLYRPSGLDRDFLQWTVDWPSDPPSATDIDVLLRDIPLGQDYSVTAYASCMGGTMGALRCVQGGSVSSPAPGCRDGSSIIPDRRHVRVRLDCAAAQVVVQVNDEGSGAPPACDAYRLEVEVSGAMPILL